LLAARKETAPSTIATSANTSTVAAPAAFGPGYHHEAGSKTGIVVGGADYYVE
jgi:hypothetical protein